MTDSLLDDVTDQRLPSDSVAEHFVALAETAATLGHLAPQIREWARRLAAMYERRRAPAGLWQRRQRGRSPAPDR